MGFYGKNVHRKRYRTRLVSNQTFPLFLLEKSNFEVQNCLNFQEECILGLENGFNQLCEQKCIENDTKDTC